MLSDNIARTAEGVLTFAGQRVDALAERCGTPLYLMDAERIRRNCRLYTEAFRRAFGENALALYASKAAAFKEMYRLVNAEGLGVDVVSSGELLTALAAGFPPEKIFFHGSCKTDDDLRRGLDAKIGYFVVDNADELSALEREAAARGVEQDILLRVTPGIDPHTYAAVNTGMVDSKFGAAIETGQAMELTEAALRCAHLRLRGLHCHVGSQVFDEDVFERTLDIMIPFLCEIRERTGVTLPMLDLGGGYGVRYRACDGEVDIPARIEAVAEHMKTLCAKLDFPLPFFLMEPGRSIAADAGMTVYTVGSVKRIPGYKQYVAVNGGMADNPRYALYGARYTAEHVTKVGNEEIFSLVGCCCESDDVIEPEASLPADTCRGDLVAVCTTGAYNYSMSSNYNRLPRPPVVMLDHGGSYVAVARESYDDVMSKDM